MSITHKFSECSDMTEEQVNECLERVDMKAFMENPTQALIDAGLSLKKGVTFKFVETEAEANSLPANVFPLKLTPQNNEKLALDDLDKVSGGNNFMFDYTTGVIGSGWGHMEASASKTPTGSGTVRDFLRNKYK